MKKTMGFYTVVGTRQDGTIFQTKTFTRKVNAERMARFCRKDCASLVAVRIHYHAKDPNNSLTKLITKQEE